MTQSGWAAPLASGGTLLCQVMYLDHVQLNKVETIWAWPYFVEDGHSHLVVDGSRKKEE